MIFPFCEIFQFCRLYSDRSTQHLSMIVKLFFPELDIHKGKKNIVVPGLCLIFCDECVTFFPQSL